MIGSTYGLLTVLSDTGKRTRSREKMYLCSCVCGSSVVVRGSSLRTNHTTSCGCFKRKSTADRYRNRLVNKRFGRLLVISDSGERQHRSVLYRCTCDCGSTVLIQAQSLVSGRARSCGCAQKEAAATTGRNNATHGQSRTKEYKSHRTGLRRAARKRRTPQWADLEAIREFYRRCPAGYQVDHVIPLQGTVVSGLHVENNLQYLTASDNSKKKNKFVPTIITQGEATVVELSASTPTDN